jgi:hypothetical protein
MSEMLGQIGRAFAGASTVFKTIKEGTGGSGFELELAGALPSWVSRVGAFHQPK